LTVILRHHLRDQDAIVDDHFRALLPSAFVQQLGYTASTLKNTETPEMKGPDDNEASRSLKAMNNDSPRELKIRSHPLATRSGGTRNVPLLVVRQLHAYLNAFNTTP